MTDDRRTAPLAGFADRFAAAASDAVALVERPFLAQVGVRVFGARGGDPDPAGLSAAEAALALPLSFPVEPQPLMSLPRFLAVLFPIFMWLALVCDERRSTDLVVALSGIALGLFTAQFASWHFIA